MRSFFASIFLFLPLLLQAQTDSLDNIQECRIRLGLPNFFAKLQAGGPVTIAYLGGSITAANGGWRDQSVKWLQAQYTGSRINQVNAGVGGTGSDLGAFRLKTDVLTHKPDLVFVEFAVNDGGPYVHQTMEGIVRQIWKADPSTDICFVYTVAGNMLPTLEQNRLWPTMLAMEHIAQHYGIPSIQMGSQVPKLIKEGKLLFNGKKEQHPDKIVFTGDNVHPHPETGHRLYAEAVARSLAQMKTVGKPASHPLIAPYTKDNWENARMLPMQQLKKSGDWQVLSVEKDSLARQFRDRIPVLLKSTQPGAALQFRFKGRMAGIYDLVGPGCGQYTVTVDGGAPKEYPRFDRHAVYYRTHYFFLPVMDDKEHSVSLAVSAQQPDKMAILKTGSNSPGDLGKYSENACYAGWLLLLGDLTTEN